MRANDVCRNMASASAKINIEVMLKRRPRPGSIISKLVANQAASGRANEDTRANSKSIQDAETCHEEMQLVAEISVRPGP